MERPRLTLPPIEDVAAMVHDGWFARKRAAGISSRKAAETGEELMVPYEDLSEVSKEANRAMVRDVYAAIDLVSDAVSLAG